MPTRWCANTASPMRCSTSTRSATKPVARVIAKRCSRISVRTLYLDALDIPYIVNSRIVRGLDYYTRTVFEVTSGVLGAQSTVCGGGRYDGLVKSLGGPDLPAVGFGLGLERFLMMLDALEGERVVPRRGVQAVALGADARARLVPIIAQLRDVLGAPVYADYDDRKLTAHFKAADRNNARFALILGSEELAAGEIVVRDLEARTDRKVPLGSGKDLAASLVEGTERG